MPTKAIGTSTDLYTATVPPLVPASAYFPFGNIGGGVFPVVRADKMLAALALLSDNIAAARRSISGLTKPVVGSFSWVNQSTATAADATDGLYLAKPTTGGFDISMLERAAPATPKVVVAIRRAYRLTGQYDEGGIYLRASATDKIITLGVTETGAISVNKWTDRNTFSAAYEARNYALLAPLLWLKIEKVSTNFTFSASINGENWIVLHTAAASDFLGTTDKAGLFVYNKNGSGIDCPTAVQYDHYAES